MENLLFEQKQWGRGLSLVAGLDEAGRGPLAGPLVAAAVILDKDHFRNNDVKHDLYLEINDSKLLSEKKREKLYDFITKVSFSYSITQIDNFEIDSIGIMEANYTVFDRALQGLNKIPQHVLTDHFKVKNLDNTLQTNITKGDRASITIAAASILAKVHRDRLMKNFHDQYPDYGFDKHKGYGTKLHRDKIMELGPCEIHRKSFEPVKSYLQHA